MIILGGSFVYILLTNFPEDAKFLSEEERHYVTVRINDDIGRTPSDKLSFKAVLTILRDWRLWCLYCPQM